MTFGAVQKGKKLEKHIVEWLHHTGIDPQAIRTPGSGSGRFRGDIYTPNIPIILECKNTARPNLKEWIEQASSQTYGYQPWAIIWHKNGIPMESSVAVIPLDLLERLLRGMSSANKD